MPEFRDDRMTGLGDMWEAPLGVQAICRSLTIICDD